MVQTEGKEIPRPLRTIRNKVSPIEVGKYYLKSEFSRVFPDEDIRGSIDNRIDQLSEKEFWRLLEAMSFAYRLNGMFWRISDESLAWSEEVWNVSDLVLTGIRPAVNKVIRSDEVGRNPIKFREFLRSYFKEHPKNDPLELDQFRPDGRKITYKKIILISDGGNPRLLDGSNRLIKLSMLGEEEIEALVARSTGVKGKIRVGDSTFWLLRNVYQRSGQHERGAIFKTAKRLGEVSYDGKEAVEKYWVEHVDDTELRSVGKRLFRSIKGS